VWKRLQGDVVSCRRCPRLRRHCKEVARTKRRAYRDEQYWGLPVPGFGDRRARILALGLAPAAHGANRTGRMFTGDRSGEWLYGAFHRAGLADRPDSVARDDGLVLRDVYLSAACRCAPPANRPTADELTRCEGFLDRELTLLSRMRVTLALGRIAWDAALRAAARAGDATKPRPRFGHGAESPLRLRAGGPQQWLVGSYHPSQQNTFTGRLTREMLDDVVERAVELCGSLRRRTSSRGTRRTG
jgi:uracil-DNA glycosylase family 4